MTKEVQDNLERSTKFYQNVIVFFFSFSLKNKISIPYKQYIDLKKKNGIVFLVAEPYYYLIRKWVRLRNLSNCLYKRCHTKCPGPRLRYQGPDPGLETFREPLGNGGRPFGAVHSTSKKQYNY